MTKKILAVSGGVDSMVMLDILGNYFLDEVASQHEDLMGYGCARPKVIVATFDHGTRPSAKDDALFVCKVAGRRYLGLPCFTAEASLGENVSEAVAREARYNFLHALAQKMQTPNMLITARSDYDESQLSPPETEPLVIYTAHHLDDLVETVAINLLRGTGWRGLAVLDTPGVRRLFLEPEYMPEFLRKWVPFDKKEIHKYAADFDVTYRQDPTNNDDNYLRNRVRRRLRNFNKKREIYDLWCKQKALKTEIDKVTAELLPQKGEAWQRSWFRDLDEKVALEMLRAGTLRAGISATRPQLENFRQAILTYLPGKSFNLPGDKLVRFSKEKFYLE